AEAFGEQLELCRACLDPSARAQLVSILDRHLAEGAVDVQGDRPHMASSVQLTWRRSGQNDTDGFVLSAQPDKSQGRPVSKSGSQPIRQRTACPSAFSQMPLVPVPATLITRPDSGGHGHIFMPGARRSRRLLNRAVALRDL